MTMNTGLDTDALAMLEDGLRKAMLSASGPELDAALADLGWADMLSDVPD
ncbi:MAG TPA: acyl-CoA dehydrogenase, partial [Mycobacterium sp.]|nr:acyl-CoA dehydrogenase [Mycobacterium sp.]